MDKKVKDFTVIIEQDEEGMYVASVPDISGCYTQGKTIPQVLERIKEAIEVCLESDKEDLPSMKFIGLQRIQITQ